ncbi:MAG: ATP-binding cassette domain-containing protein [Candidatus Cloacimonadales bacterium]
MIQLQKLVKNYGDLCAVNALDLEIHDGEILGFLGPNGAGKSTTFKVLTGYISPSSGNITVGKYNILEHSKQIREMIGYLPENNPLYVEMTVYDYLKFVGEIRKVTDFKHRLKEVIEQCGLHGVVHKQINTLSKGYKQRVGIAQAILHDPEILILDEPTSGLDPNQIAEIRDLIIELGKAKTLIISSHIMQEVQAVCDRIVIIDQGSIVADGKTEELKNSFGNRSKLILEIQNATAEELWEIKEKIAGIEKMEVAELADGILLTELEYAPDKDIRPDLYQYIKQQTWILLEMHRHYISLEEVFRNLTTPGGRT